MKKNYILKITSLALICFFLSSFEDGPANGNKDATGSPFNNASCSSPSCHGSSLSAGNLSVSILDLTDNPVTSYTPGENYTIRLSVVGGSLTHFGFQLLVLNNLNNPSAVSIGTLTPNSPNTQITDFNGKKYAEHSSQLSSGIIEINWVAPMAGTGTANIYAVAINANNNGAKTGDQPLVPITASLTESISSGLNSSNKLNSSIRLVTNSTNQLEAYLKSNVAGSFDFLLMDIAGKVLETRVQQVNIGENRFLFSTENLSKGVYTLRVSDGTSTLAGKFVR
jgi:Reeler domain